MAGLQPGDVVIDDRWRRSSTQPGDLTALVREYAPGTVIPVVYQRAGSSHTVQVKLAADAG